MGSGGECFTASSDLIRSSHILRIYAAGTGTYGKRKRIPWTGSSGCHPGDGSRSGGRVDPIGIFLKVYFRRGDSAPFFSSGGDSDTIAVITGSIAEAACGKQKAYSFRTHSFYDSIKKKEYEVNAYVLPILG